VTTNMKKTTYGIGLATGANKSIGHAGHTRVRERQLAPRMVRKVDSSPLAADSAGMGESDAGR
jgi:hypothetical protein